MKILIGYDGSECADAAIDDLRRAGLPQKAEAQVLTVAEVWLPPPDPTETNSGASGVEAVIAPMYAKARRAVEEAQNAANRGRARVSTLFPSWSVTGTGTYGSPAWELVFVADKWQPDLVVVGSQGHSALGRFVLGSVSQVVLNEAQCSVRIARGSKENKTSRLRIIVGVDGSPCSAATVRAATERTWPPGSEAYVVTAYDPIVPTAVGQFIPPVVAMVEEGNEGQLESARRMAEEAAEELRRVGLAVSTVVRAGDPKRVLLEEAETLAVDSIFVGARGLSRINRFLLGSVSAAIAARAHCSVEVVRSRLVR